MILQALVQCYEALAEKGELEKPGWSPVKVSWGLELDENGQVLSLLPMGGTDAKGKQVPQSMKLPDPVKRSSGVAANFLCDNSAYMLGIDAKGKPERTRECFAACVRKHMEILEYVQHPMAKAILRFFENWKPESAAQNPVIQPHLEMLLKGGNIIFVMEDEAGETQFAQDIPEIRSAWDEAYTKTDDAVIGRCLVTGKEEPIAILHPSIKGVMGAQSSGASLVSFNAPAFESYGKEMARDNQGQGRNAPVGKYAAFAYGAALNYMIQQRNYHGRLGDTTLIYWAEGAEPAYGDVFMAMMGMGDDDKNEITQNELNGVMTALCQGQNVKWDNVPLNPENRFYILGLAPNASRLSVRFFLRDSFGAFVKHYQEHQERLNIVRPSFDNKETLSMWALLRETVNPNSRDKAPQPQLVGELLRSVLTGSLYPAELFMQTEIRLRAEKNITRGKAAIIKAWLLRNVVQVYDQRNEKHVYEEVLTVELNEQTTYLPYRLGRLFAVMEKIQKEANPNINTTIKDRYFNSACATPALVFPTLVNLAQKHLNKIGGGASVYYEKMMTELYSSINQSYPVRMSLQDQGIFQIGYYHQQQKLYMKKEDKDNG